MIQLLFKWVTMSVFICKRYSSLSLLKHRLQWKLQLFRCKLIILFHHRRFHSMFYGSVVCFYFSHHTPSTLPTLLLHKQKTCPDTVGLSILTCMMLVTIQSRWRKPQNRSQWKSRWIETCPSLGKNTSFRLYRIETGSTFSTTRLRLNLLEPLFRSGSGWKISTNSFWF